MRGNLWPAGTISGGCAVRYSGLRSSGYEQGSNEGYEKNDSGAHAGIVVAIIPGSGNDSVAIRLGGPSFPFWFFASRFQTVGKLWCRGLCFWRCR